MSALYTKRRQAAQPTSPHPTDIEIAPAAFTAGVNAGSRWLGKDCHQAGQESRRDHLAVRVFGDHVIGQREASI